MLFIIIFGTLSFAMKTYAKSWSYQEVEDAEAEQIERDADVTKVVETGQHANAQTATQQPSSPCHQSLTGRKEREVDSRRGHQSLLVT